MSANNSVIVEVDSLYQGKTQIGSEIYALWKYNILMRNNHINKIQVVGRYWKIVEANGLIREVSGDGVIGERPVINPGKSFYYSSYANLKASSGIMYGKYKVVDLVENAMFEVAIPAFSLDSPEEKILSN